MKKLKKVISSVLAVGMLAASRSGGPVHLVLHEPGGTLGVDCDEGATWLHGSVQLEGCYEL